MSSKLKSLLFIGLPLFLLPLVYFPGLVDVGLIPRFLFLAMFVGISVAATLEYRARTPLTSANPNPIRPVLVVYSLYMVWITARMILSPNKSEALFDWQRSGLLFCFWIIMVQGMRREEIPISLIIKVVSVFAGVLLALGVAQLILLLTGGELTHHLTYHIRGFAGHRNLFSQLLMLTLPFSLAGVWLLRGGWRWVCGLILALTLSAVTFLLARSVWVSVVGASSITMVLALVFRKQWITNGAAGRKFTGWIVGGLILTVIGGTAVLYTKADRFETLMKTSKEMGSVQYGTPKERIRMWQTSWKMFKAKPVAGAGLASWKINFPGYGLEGLRPEAEAGAHHFQRPHNDFFWVLTESGGIGLLLWLGIFATSMWSLLTTLRTHENRESRIVALLMLFGILLYLGVSLFSFPKERIEHGVYLMIFMAIGERMAGNSRFNWQIPEKWVPLLLIGMMIFVGSCLFTGLFRFQGEYFTGRALTARAAGDQKAVVWNADAALSPFYKMDPTATPVYWYKGEALFLQGETESAHHAFQLAYGLHPHHIHVLNNLAATTALLETPQNGKRYLQHALNISPTFEEAGYNLTALHFQCKEIDSAWTVFSNLKPDYGNPRYLQSVDLITLAYLQELATAETHPQLKEMFIRMGNDGSWRLKLHKKAVMDDLDYATQVRLDAIYILEKVDKTLTFNDAEKLRQLYQL